MANTIMRSSLTSIRSMKKVTLSETIADTIAQAIADQSIHPGERIVEVALAQKLNVSRVPVREALKILATQGVLQDGRQSYEVRHYSDRDVAQVMEARMMLETILLRDAIERWRDEGLAKAEPLEVPLEQMEIAANAGQVENFRKSDLEFHRMIAVSAGNEIVHTLWETTARHVLIVLNVPDSKRVNLGLMARRHADLLKFINRQIRKPGTSDDIHAALEAHFV